MNIRWNHIAILTSILLAIGACVEPIDLDLPAQEERIVVYGWVTSENKPHEITVTRTLDFNNNSPYPPVSGAQVYVLDRLDQRYDFLERGNTGVYVSDSTDLVTRVGDAFTLYIITLDGMQIISSEEEIKNLPPLSSTIVEFVSDPQEVNLEPDDPNYFVTGFVEDEINIRNYYRWQVLVNDSIRNSPEELVLFDDQFTDGNLFRFDASNVLFTENDRVSILHMSMNQEAYNYYVQLKDLTGNDLVGPVVQSFPLIGNLREVDTGRDVLGYFGASDVHLVEVQWPL